MVHGSFTNPKKVHEKKTGQKWMKDQKKQINFQKKMKRSSEKQDLPSPLFESFSAVIVEK